MKNQNTIFIATVLALAFALAAVTEAAQHIEGGPAYSTSHAGEQLPLVTIYSTGNVLRGKTGSFVLDTNPPLMFGGTFVNFKVSGTAMPGVDYVSPVAPAYIGEAGYGAISVATLPDPRGSAGNGQAYSVVVTLEPGAGYAVGEPNSAIIWISSTCPEPCW